MLDHNSRINESVLSAAKISVKQKISLILDKEQEALRRRQEELAQEHRRLRERERQMNNEIRSTAIERTRSKSCQLI